MHIVIINDCKDQNAVSRQITKTSSLFGGTSTSFIGVNNDIEASGNLIDVLDAFEDSEGVVLVNVAPRNGTAKKWKNGTPFGYFKYKNVLVVSTIDGCVLSLVKKLKLVKEIAVLDIDFVLDKMIAKGYLKKELKDHIINTQFRSYNFAPRVAHFLFNKNNIEGNILDIKELPDILPCIWWIDNFGNCKTSLFRNEILDKHSLIDKVQNLSFYLKLKDVPDDEIAFVEGSSGLGDKRFVEIVAQGKRAKDVLDFKISDLILK